MIISVTCILLFHNDKVLAAQRSKHMNLPLLWEFPGGKVEMGETEEACIIREIQEEIGISVQVIEKLSSFDHSYESGKVVRLIPFLGIWVSGEIQLLEHQQVKWLERSGLMKYNWAPADLPIVRDLERNWDYYLKKVLNFQSKP